MPSPSSSLPSTTLTRSQEILFDEIFRTPLGGFINHSDDPNCVKYPVDSKYYIKYYIKTIKPIKAGEELFLKYTFYSVHK